MQQIPMKRLRQTLRQATIRLSIDPYRARPQSNARRSTKTLRVFAHSGCDLCRIGQSLPQQLELLAAPPWARNQAPKFAVVRGKHLEVELLVDQHDVATDKTVSFSVGLGHPLLE
jgi:hypothetical protein